MDLELFFVAQVRGLGELAVEAFTRFAVFCLYRSPLADESLPFLLDCFTYLRALLDCQDEYLLGRLGQAK